MPPYVYALIAHGIIGALDVFVNHEWLAKLPSRPGCAGEEGLHSAREFVFAALFASLAWFEWHGAFAWWIVALFAAETAISARDVVVEGDVRALPASERLLHLFLFMNLGVLFTLGGQALLGWHDLPTRLAPVDHGWASWVLTAMALGALGWAVRDSLAAVRLRRAA
ncbi:hypothetical protein [Massilia consociata]|uniref:DUF2243 domain-containing protein n=1 Tax=Massilia consociata TaxID=760117 RepID=A0ABV6FFI5_9BURK